MRSKVTLLTRTSCPWEPRAAVSHSAVNSAGSSRTAAEKGMASDPDGLGGPVFLHDRPQIGRTGAVHDDSVAAEVELPAHRSDTLRRRAGSARCQPLIRNQS